MRIEKIEQIVLRLDEVNTLNELWEKLNNLKIEDNNVNRIRRNLQDAISDFLGSVKDDLD